MKVKGCKNVKIMAGNIKHDMEYLQSITVIAIDGGKGKYCTAVQIDNQWVFTVINGVMPKYKIAYLTIDVSGTNVPNDASGYVVVKTAFAKAVSEAIEITSYKEEGGSYGNYTYNINNGQQKFSFRAGEPYVEMLSDAFPLAEEQKMESPLYRLFKNK